MKILRLELFGFKSFKDKTVVTFDQPITAIVGSNGCGKSNVVDALYWVMGDMSPKHLRGSHMSDVIFSGSKDAAPLDLAEVTLVLERDPAKDPELPPQYQASNEIQITRRYYRSGEGEYLINKVQCRLRDIQEFFMDTGMGAKAYSIVEQGAISRLISLKPEERRVIIEEVAGVMKFKARKAETLRKIENSKLNLQRVDDIVQDLQKQLASLKRQADKAERFKALSEKLKALEIRLATREWLERNDSKAAAILEATELKHRLEELEKSLEERRERLTVSEEELHGVEAELHTNREEVKTLELGYKDLQSEEANLRTRLENLQHRKEGNDQTLVGLDEREQVLVAELESVRAQITDKDLAIEDLQAQLEATEEAHHRLQEELESLRQQLKVEEKDLHRLELEQTRMTQEMQTLQRSLAQTEDQKTHLEEQVENIGSELELSHAERQSTLGSLEQAFATRTELETEKHAVDEELHRLEGEKQSANDARDRSSQELARVTIRKEQLEALERDLDGIESAAKALVLGLRNDGHDKNLLADQLKVPTLLEKSVEAVLGRSLQRVVASDLTQVEALRAELLEKSGDPKVRQGRAPFWLPSMAKNLRTTQVDLDNVFMSAPVVAEVTADIAEPAVDEVVGQVIPDGAESFSNDLVGLEEAFTTPNADYDGQAMSYHVGSSDDSHPADAGAFAALNADPAVLNQLIEREIVGPDGLIAFETREVAATPHFEKVEPVKLISARDYLLTNPQVIGPLDELVRNEMSVDAAETGEWLALLSGFWVLRSREALLELSAFAQSIPVHFVTLDGDVLYRNGFLDLAPIEAGSDEQGTGLIQRKRVIQSLRDDELRLRDELARAQAELDQKIRAIQAAKEKFRELTSQLSALNPDVERYSTFLRQVEAKMARLSEKKSLLQEQLEKARAHAIEVGEKIQDVTNRLSESEERKLSQAERLANAQDELQTKQSEMQASASQLSERRNESRSLDKALGELQSQRAALEQEHSLIGVRKNQISEENGRFGEQSAELGGQAEENNLRQSAKLSQLRQAQDLLAETVDKVDASRRGLKELQSELETLSSDFNKVNNRVRDLDQNVAVNEVELRNISVKLEESYAIALEQLDKEKVVELSTPDNIEELADPASGKSHASDLRRKIENLGKINMVAIEEFEDVRARHEYLFIQREDLSEGIRQLKDAIDRIDRESRERFAEAYHAVNEAFKTTFPLLFGGGNAELRLTQPDNMLETGVEIVAQPPGKKLQSVTLLSGGEKALTAVSLIFGIFSIKPSPFCVLDEVDAPLDDANVGRFNRLVRAITDRSQVIMITHHKKSMESCDALFGVTMERPGISKVASVRLGEMSDAVARGLVGAKLPPMATPTT